jgi:hypothetical protein
MPAAATFGNERAAIRRNIHTGRPFGTPEFIEALEKAIRRKLAPNKGSCPEAE